MIVYNMLLWQRNIWKNTPERFYFDYTNYKECYKNSEKLYEVRNNKNNKYREDNTDYKFLYDSKIIVNYCYPIFLSFYNFNCTYYYNSLKTAFINIIRISY